MLIHNTLDGIFSSPSAVKVLRVLKNSVIGLTGRQIAYYAGITHQTAHNTLANLEAMKVVSRTIGGASHLFLLERDNYITKKIIEKIFDAETEYKEEILSLIIKYLNKNTVSVILFGSVARREETPQSDLDLCIVYDKGKKELEKNVEMLRKRLYKEYGSLLSPFFITASEFKKKGGAHKPPVDKVIKEGIVLCGKKCEELL
jgi:predicted nucleotidyltransferase